VLFFSRSGYSLEEAIDIVSYQRFPDENVGDGGVVMRCYEKLETK
jgi:hypothetical protein